MRRIALGMAMWACVTSGTAAAAADNVTCDSVVSIMNLKGVLYKPVNKHGARGPTFLVQNPIERTGKRRLQIRDVQCRRISSFGLFNTDFPFGARYYQRSGGSRHTPKQLLSLAKKAGSTAILVEGVGGKWILVKNPRKREGIIYG